VKALAFVFGLCIAILGAVGIVMPSVLGWIAAHFVTSAAFYFLAVVRVGFGLLLIRVASASRAARAIRVLGYFVAIAGVTTALMGLLGIDRARAMIDWWWRQGPGFVRLTAILVVALGSFVAFACAPARRAAG
jgi:hypothetical protein